MGGVEERPSNEVLQKSSVGNELPVCEVCVGVCVCVCVRGAGMSRCVRGGRFNKQYIEWSMSIMVTLYNTAKLMGPKVSIACVWTCVSRPPSIIQPS